MPKKTPKNFFVQSVPGDRDPGDYLLMIHKVVVLDTVGKVARRGGGGGSSVGRGFQHGFQRGFQRPTLVSRCLKWTRLWQRLRKHCPTLAAQSQLKDGARRERRVHIARALAALLVEGSPLVEETAGGLFIRSSMDVEGEDS